MANSALKDLLKSDLGSFERPEALPEGTYTGRIKKHTFGQSSQKKTDYIAFEINATGFKDNVDAEELENVLNGEKLSTKTFTKTIYVTAKAMFQVKEFFANLGFQVEGRPTEELLPETNNLEVEFDLSRNPTRDGKAFYNEVGEVRAAG